MVDLIVDSARFFWLYSNMPKISNLPSIYGPSSASDGFSHIVVLMSFLVIVGAIGFVMRPETAQNERAILGTAASSTAQTTRKGFSLTVVSNNGNWDFYQYLCKSFDECRGSATSGFQLPTISGGQTEGYEIFVEPTQDWNDFSFIKYYVKPGWTDAETVFVPEMHETITGARIHTFEEPGTQAIIAPVAAFRKQFYNITTFSDN